MTTRSRPTRGTPWARRDAAFRATVIGCGLIGGSLALALRRRWAHVHLTGIDRPAVLERARREGLIDTAVPRQRCVDHLATADDALIILALPVDAALALLPDLARALRERPKDAQPLVLDVGSVKAPIVALAEQLSCPRFVGGHPMAGSERTGLAHASATLFDDRRFVLCPPRGTSRADRRAADVLVRGLGAEPLEIEARLHDRCVAMVSHVPHLVALALMESASRLHTTLPKAARARDLPWRLAAGAWRDATRVAAADPAVWQSIFSTNAEAIALALDDLIDTLISLRDALRAGGHELLMGGAGGLRASVLARARRRIHRYLP